MQVGVFIGGQLDGYHMMTSLVYILSVDTLVHHCTTKTIISSQTSSKYGVDNVQMSQ